MSLDLTAQAVTNLPDLSDLPVRTESETGVAIRTWKGRMVNEYASAGVWSVLVRQLMEAVAPPELVMGAAEAATDELQHAVRCAGVVLALGGEPVAPMPALAGVPRHEDAGRTEAVLRNLVSVGCMSETIAVAIIRAEHAELESGPLAAVLSGILADEIRHARLGWKSLGVLLESLDGDAVARLDQYLVDAFAHQVVHEVPKLPLLPDVSVGLSQAGVCDGGFARTLFVDTIEQIIVPGLDSVGLAGTSSWAIARSHTAQYLQEIA